MQARDYQERAVESVFTEWKHVNRTLGVAPTGAGKTNIACEVIRRMLPKRTLFLAHRTELVSQTRDRLAQFGIDSEIEQGQLVASGSLWNQSPVVIATPQTLFAQSDKRLKRFNPSDFGCLIVDELHHYVAPAFRRPLLHFCQNPQLKTLGLTATADRSDGKALSQIMDSVAFNIEILELIKEGWLVPVTQQMVKVESLDFSHCRVSGDDFNQRDLEEVMREEKNLQGVAAASLDVIGTKRSIVFCVRVSQAERLSEIFNRHRAHCASWICGKTLPDDRSETLKNFSEGKLQILVNVGVLTEGWDEPKVEVVVQARPTLSRSLYSQMIGRGMRPLTGILHSRLENAEQRREAIAASTKPNLLVLDFCGNSGRLKLINTSSILGGHISEEAKERAIKKLLENGKAQDISEAMLEAEAELRAEIDERKKREAASRKDLTAKAQFSLTYIDPLDVFKQRREAWKGFKPYHKLSHKERSLVLRYGGDPDRLGVEGSRQFLNQKTAITQKQKWWLLHHGYKAEELDDLKVWEASKMIEAAKANDDWRPGHQPETVKGAENNQPVLDNQMHALKKLGASAEQIAKIKTSTEAGQLILNLQQKHVYRG